MSIKQPSYTSQFNRVRAKLEDVIPLDTPFVVYIEPSSFCNLRCKFCPQSLNAEGISKSIMDYTTFENACKSIKLFPHRLKKIRFCGTGEPLYNRSLLNMAKLSREFDLADTLELITNATLLTEDDITQLPIYLDKIIISLEGFSTDDYLRFSSKKIDFSRLVDNINAMASVPNKRAVIHVKIHHLVLPDRAECQKKLQDLFGKYVDEFFIEGVVDMWPGAKQQQALEGRHRFFDSPQIPTRVCPQIFKSLQINANGDVIPCCVDWRAMNLLGNIKQQSLQDIWNGEKLRNLRLKHLLGERKTFMPCMECSMNESCETDNIDNSANKIIERIQR